MFVILNLFLKTFEFLLEVSIKELSCVSKDKSFKTVKSISPIFPMEYWLYFEIFCDPGSLYVSPVIFCPLCLDAFLEFTLDCFLPMLITILPLGKTEMSTWHWFIKYKAKSIKLHDNLWVGSALLSLKEADSVFMITTKSR